MHSFSGPHGRILRTILVGIMLALLAACAARSETEQLEALRDGFIYKRYRQLSSVGLPAALAAYSKSIALAGEPPPPASGPEVLCVARVLMAYSAITAGRNTIGIAETDLVEIGGCSELAVTAAASLRSVAFHRKGWNDLAHTESERAWQGFDQEQALEQQETLLVLHVALAYASVRDKRWDRVLLHVDAIAVQLDAPWVGDIGHAVVAVKEGRTVEALRLLKRANEHEQIPPEIGDELSRLMAGVETYTGDVDDALFRLLARAMWQALRMHGPDALRATTRFIDESAWQPLKQDAEDGYGNLRGRWQRWREGRGDSD